jgi:hypothetical protein
MLDFVPMPAAAAGMATPVTPLSGDHSDTPDSSVTSAATPTGAADGTTGTGFVHALPSLLSPTGFKLLSMTGATVCP